MPKKSYEIRIRETVVGYKKIILTGHEDQPWITLSPQQFKEVFPTLSLKLKFGWEEVNYATARKLFGAQYFTYNGEAVSA